MRWSNVHSMLAGLRLVLLSGVGILYNAFLNWRRAPLSLHNAPRT